MFLFKTTVDSVLANFNKTIEDLLIIKEVNVEMAVSKNVKAMKLKAEAHGHTAEANRADAIANKISALISADK